MRNLFGKSKNNIALRSLLVVFALAVMLSSCSTSNGIEGEGPYDTMIDAVNVINNSEGKELYFVSGLYLYEDQESYDARQPAYSIVMTDNIISDNNEMAFKSYKVRDNIELTGTVTHTVIEENIDNINSTDFQERLNNAANSEDLTHAVVDLAKAEGRDIADEAFSNGFSIYGYSLPEASIFTVSMRIQGDDGVVGYIQAQYHTDTEEISVAESFDSGLSAE
jgi:hypothetical protein